MTQILDYSLARPDPAQIKAKGYSGVMRYVAPLPLDAAKVITSAEYHALLTAGLLVGLNWEWYSNRAREGALAGAADAQSALAQAKALGYTGAIYFSVDYDAPEQDQPGINAYFQACAVVITKARLGAYGGYWPLSRLFDAGLISFGWQTLAWSGGNREARASIYQNGRTDLGACDVNDVLKANWAGGVVAIPGGWSADKSAQYTVQGDGTLKASNGQGVYGWILDSMRRILASPNNLALFSVLYGLPTSGQTKDASGNWWQSFEHIKVRVSSTNQNDYGFQYVPAAPAPDPTQELAAAQAEINTFKTWLDAAPKL